MSGITIGLAGKPDADEAWAIVQEYYDAVSVVVREDANTFLAAFFGAQSGIWLARTADDVVGCVALRPLDAVPAAGEVKRLYVKPAARGRGIAELLLAALEEYAVAAGYQALYLDSKDDLEAAIHFYEKHGYTHCARYNDNPQATIFMRKLLKAQAK
jgi:ribosomal protein S18 acetylase RimI-like enzyme